MNPSSRMFVRFAALWFSVPAALLGQTVHPVAPDTKGNRIELSVANTSTNAPAESLTVRIGKSSPHVAFSSAMQSIRFIQPGKEGAAVFLFDVKRDAPVNKKDTLEFLVTDKSGFAWTKSVIVQYSGPMTFGLDQNYPNPFNPTTTIYFQLPKDSRVSLKVYDLLGREVTTLVNEDRAAGYHDARFNAGNFASGVYFYRMEAKPGDGGQGFQQTRKMVVVK